MNLDLINPEVKADILGRIEKITPESKALWGTMNVSQMLAHLNAQIAVALGEEKLPSSFVGKLFGGMMKKFVLTEKPYSKGLPTAPTFIIKNTPDFHQNKSKLLAAVTKFNEDTIMKEPHPVFGKMTLEEWSKATWKHIDHHLKQFGE